MNDIYAIPKTEYEAIDRLEELKEYCMDEMLSENGSGIWAGDIVAIETAIQSLKNQINKEA